MYILSGIFVSSLSRFMYFLELSPELTFYIKKIAESGSLDPLSVRLHL